MRRVLDLLAEPAEAVLVLFDREDYIVLVVLLELENRFTKRVGLVLDCQVAVVQSVILEFVSVHVVLL